jgi:hypothetical protein
LASFTEYPPLLSFAGIAGIESNQLCYFSEEHIVLAILYPANPAVGLGSAGAANLTGLSVPERSPADSFGQK